MNEQSNITQKLVEIKHFLMRFVVVSAICFGLFANFNATAIASSAPDSSFFATVSHHPSIFAFGSTKSKLTEGTVQLDEIENRAEDVAKGAVSAKELQARAQGGINEVQGDADVNKMNRSGNSKQATTVLDQVQKDLKASSKK